MVVRELLYKLQQLDPEARISLVLFNDENDERDYFQDFADGVTVDNVGDEQIISIINKKGDI